MKLEKVTAVPDLEVLAAGWSEARELVSVISLAVRPAVHKQREAMAAVPVLKVGLDWVVPGKIPPIRVMAVPAGMAAEAAVIGKQAAGINIIMAEAAEVAHLIQPQNSALMSSISRDLILRAMDMLF